MPGRDQKIYEEAAALWRQLYDQPPPATDGRVILDLILDDLPTGQYDRLATPHLRRTNITFPKY